MPIGHRTLRKFSAMLVVVLVSLALGGTAAGQVAGQNINMVSGTDWTTGDPFLQRQNEPSIAVSTRNPQHLLAGANDYRSVDLPGLLGIEEQGDAWLGVFKSTDGGWTWKSFLLYGYPQDSSPQGLSSPIHGRQAAADPTVRSGPAGMFYMSGIAFDRSKNGTADVFVSSFIDNNNKENGDTTHKAGSTTNVQPTDSIVHLGTTLADTGTSGQFLDKPWLAVDIPRGGSTCTIKYTNPDGSSASETIPAGRIFLGYASFTGANTTKINFVSSTSCAQKWGSVTKISESSNINQGTIIAVDPSNPTATRATVYVAWRRFAAGNQSDAIMIVKSTDGGSSFSKPSVAVGFPLSCATTPTQAGCPFDQGLTTAGPSANNPYPYGGSIRTNTYPALAVDASGRVYLAWSQRQANGDSRLMMMSSSDGLIWNPAGAALVDSSNLGANLTGRGHQIMPSLTFNAGKLTLVWYDLRLDHTTGLYSPVFTSTGFNFVEQSRELEGELANPYGCPVGSSPDPTDSVFGPFLSDTPYGVGNTLFALACYRHTIDVMGAQLDPASFPSGVTPFRISQYDIGLTDFSTGSTQARQMQFNVPGLPLFVKGTQPFMGDYVDVAGAPPFVFKSGRWQFNTDSSNPQVYHAAWADNRDVRPPPFVNGQQDWIDYTPPFSSSVGQPDAGSGQIPAQCVEGMAGMRNQNIYTSRITPGQVIGTPANSKPLSNTLQRAFSIFVQNSQGQPQSYRLMFAPLAAGITASFVQLPSQATSFCDASHCDFDLASYSTGSRPVFVTATAANATFTVQVFQISASGASSTGALLGSVTINPDPSSPALNGSFLQPDGTTQLISASEFYNPAIGNPAIGNPAIGNPAIGNSVMQNPAIGNPAIGNQTVINPAIGNPAIGNTTLLTPAIGNPAIGNPAIGNPALATTLGNPAIGNPAIGNTALQNGDLTNPAIGNPAIGNPAIGNPAIGNTPVTDANYTLTNQGNTSATYAVKAYPTSPLPPGVTLQQVILSKLYNTPTEENCQLFNQTQALPWSNVVNPPLATASNVANPAIGNPAIGNPTVAVAPGETVQLTFRFGGIAVNAVDPSQTPGDYALFQQATAAVIPVAVSQQINTPDIGTTNQPPLATPGSSLLILTTAVGGANPLPNGISGKPYGATLAATGGTQPYVWSLASGSLPAGLTLASSGAISGTPSAAGTYNFKVQVTDSATPTQHTATSTTLTIVIVNPLVITTTTLPDAVVGNAYSVTLQATGGQSPYIWSVASGTLPPGFSLTTSGTLANTTPANNVAGNYSFTVQAVDSFAPQQTATQPLTIHVAVPLAITTTALPVGIVGTAYNSTVAATGGTPAYNWTATQLPADLAINAGTGAITGTPSAVTINSPSTFSVTDSGNPAQSAFKSLEIMVLPTWSTVAPISVVTEGASASLINGNLYVSHGYHSGVDTADLLIYNLGNNSWSSGPSALVARSELSSGMVNGKHYAIGGRNSVTVATNEMYDPASNTWTTKASMPTARAGLGVATWNGFIYAIGGRDGDTFGTGTPQTAVERYDPSTDTWTSLASLPTAVSDVYATVAYNGNIYVFGGETSSASVTNLVQIYNIGGNSWSTGHSMPTARGAAMAAVVGDQIVVFGGYDGTSNLAVTEVYNPQTDTWSTGPALTQAASEIAAGITYDSNNVFAVGSGIFGNSGTVVQRLNLNPPPPIL